MIKANGGDVDEEFFNRYLSFFNCHWKVGSVSQTNEMEDRLTES